MLYIVCMLAPRYKINSELFKKYHNKGIKKFSPHIRYVFVNIDEDIHSRCAVVVSKKIAKSAVSRNKQRRRVYNILSDIYPHICKGNYIFLFIQKNVLDINYKELQQEIERMLLSK